MSEYQKREHYKTISAVLILLFNGDKVLLQKRSGTGFADGMWDFSASGHVEENEPLSRTVAREAKEELGIEVKNSEFVGLIHSLGEDGIPRYLAVFKIDGYVGEPKICEPDKCSELKWFDINDLPENIIGSRKMSLERINEPGFYFEIGWDGKTAI